MSPLTRRLFTSLLLLTVAAPLAAQRNAEPATRQSWTSDRIRLRVGDVVTVLIDERTLASANLRENASDRRRRDMAAGVSLPEGESMAGSLGSDRDVESRRSGESVRGNSIQGEISARVVAISPTGMLQLEGEKEMRVDRGRQTMMISGWVRPNDIAVATNTVESWRLADAEIRLRQRGRLGKPKGGLIGAIVGLVWP
jgi:flagellar L-ring protein precursor FlgH